MNTTRHFREQICDVLGVAYDTPGDAIVNIVKSLMPVADYRTAEAYRFAEWRAPGSVPSTTGGAGGHCPARGFVDGSRLPHEPDDDPPGLASLEVCRHCRGVYRA